MQVVRDDYIYPDCKRENTYDDIAFHEWMSDVCIPGEKELGSGMPGSLFERGSRPVPAAGPLRHSRIKAKGE